MRAASLLDAGVMPFSWKGEAKRLELIRLFQSSKEAEALTLSNNGIENAEPYIGIRVGLRGANKKLLGPMRQRAGGF